MACRQPAAVQRGIPPLINLTAIHLLNHHLGMTWQHKTRTIPGFWHGVGVQGEGRKALHVWGAVHTQQASMSRSICAAGKKATRAGAELAEGNKGHMRQAALSVSPLSLRHKTKSKHAAAALKNGGREQSS